MSRVYGRANGYQYADVNINGKRRRLSLKTKNKREADQNLTDLLVKLKTQFSDSDTIAKISFRNTLDEFTKYRLTKDCGTLFRLPKLLWQVSINDTAFRRIANNCENYRRLLEIADFY